VWALVGTLGAAFLALIDSSWTIRPTRRREIAEGYPVKPARGGAVDHRAMGNY